MLRSESVHLYYPEGTGRPAQRPMVPSNHESSGARGIWWAARGHWDKVAGGGGQNTMGRCPSPHPRLPGTGGRLSQDSEAGAWLPPSPNPAPPWGCVSRGKFSRGQPAFCPMPVGASCPSTRGGVGVGWVPTQPEAQVPGQGAVGAGLC